MGLDDGLDAPEPREEEDRRAEKHVKDGEQVRISRRWSKYELHQVKQGAAQVNNLTRKV